MKSDFGDNSGVQLTITTVPATSTVTRWGEMPHGDRTQEYDRTEWKCRRKQQVGHDQVGVRKVSLNILSRVGISRRPTELRNWPDGK